MMSTKFRLQSFSNFSISNISLKNKKQRAADNRNYAVSYSLLCLLYQIMQSKVKGQFDKIAAGNNVTLYTVL